MPRTLTALFDSRDQADRARARLRDAGVHDGDIRMFQPDAADQRKGADGRSLWQQFQDLFVDDNDAHAHAEGVRRGGIMVTVQAAERDAERIADILDGEGSVDLDERERGWRGEGWRAADTDRPDDRPDDRAARREPVREGSRVRSYRADERPVSSALATDTRTVETRPATGAGHDVGHAVAASAFAPAAANAGSQGTSGDWKREELMVRRSADGRIVSIDDPVRRMVVHVDDPDGAARRAAA